MQFFERQFLLSHQFNLTPTLIPLGFDSLGKLMQAVDMRVAFVVYQGGHPEGMERLLVHCNGGYRGIFELPTLFDGSDVDSQNGFGQKLYLLDFQVNSSKIIHLPIENLSTDSGPYPVPFRKFYTRQSARQILTGLRKEGWKDILSSPEAVGPEEFFSASLDGDTLREV